VQRTRTIIILLSQYACKLGGLNRNIPRQRARTTLCTASSGPRHKDGQAKIGKGLYVLGAIMLSVWKVLPFGDLANGYTICRLWRLTSPYALLQRQYRNANTGRGSLACCPFARDDLLLPPTAQQGGHEHYTYNTSLVAPPWPRGGAAVLGSRRLGGVGYPGAVPAAPPNGGTHQVGSLTCRRCGRRSVRCATRISDSFPPVRYEFREPAHGRHRARA